MTALVQHKNNSDKLAPLFLAIAALVMLYLLYLDDGLYSFAWMASPVAWVLYAVYTIVLFIPQVLLARYVFKKKTPGVLRSVKQCLRNYIGIRDIAIALSYKKAPGSLTCTGDLFLSEKKHTFKICKQLIPCSCGQVPTASRRPPGMNNMNLYKGTYPIY